MIKAIIKNSIEKSKLERKKGEIEKELIMEIHKELEPELDIIACKVGSLNVEQFKKDIIPAIIQALGKELEFEIAGGKPVDEDVKKMYSDMIEAKQKETVYL